MREVNLLRSIPQSPRNIQKRLDARDTHIIEESKKYGELYFDGPREYGYGGYKYDGRWRSVARDIISEYSLQPGQKVLDIGCAKGFLVYDLMLECPGLEVYGLDISEYALMYCHPEVVGRLHLGSALRLPFPNKSFESVLSINTLHNLSRDKCKEALKEIERVSKGHSFVQVDSYHTEEQKTIFESWVLTAEYHDFPDKWIELFKEAGYTGDFFWTIIE